MKPVLLLALVGVVTGALGAGLVTALHDEPPAPASDPAERLALTTRLRALEDEHARLVQRVRELELTALVLDHERAPSHELVEPIVEVEAPRAPEAAPAQVAQQTAERLLDEELSTRVGEVIAQMRAQEEEQREQAREEARQNLLDEQIAKLTEELGLSYYQAEEMRRILTAQSSQFRAVLEDAREKGTWGSMRDDLRGLRESTESELAALLSPSQLEGYQGSEWGGAMFGGGRWRGFDGAGPGGPGGPGSDG